MLFGVLFATLSNLSFLLTDNQHPMLTDDVINQIKEMHESIIIKKTETISLSSFNTINWQAFSLKTGVKIDWIDNIDNNKSSTDIDDIEEYIWTDYPESHETQHKNYMSYLQKHLNPLPGITILDVATNKTLLRLYNDPRLPFNLSDGTDVILTKTAALSLPETGIRAVIELVRRHILKFILKLLLFTHNFQY